MLLTRKKNQSVSPDFALIAGPCVLESEDLAMTIAEHLSDVTQRLGIPLIFKASFDKANRSSVHSFRGLGIEKGLRILEKIRTQFAIPVITDVHESYQVPIVSDVVDMLQIPAFLCRQTDLIRACMVSGCSVNIKKGQFLSPQEMFRVAEKARAFAAEEISLCVCERGTSFGYNNLVVDMRSLVILRQTGEWIVFDATHSVQLPGSTAQGSGGESCFVAPLAKAALAVGVDALFMETHPRPDEALSDGPNSVPLSDMEGILSACQAIARVSHEQSGVM